MASTPPVGVSNVQTIIDGVSAKTGKKICKRVYFDYNCAACRKIQIGNQAHVCNHLTFLRPRVMNSDNTHIAVAAYGGASNASHRELYGSALIPRNLFISQTKFEALKNKPRKAYSEFVKSPDYVFVSIDPSGSARKRADTEKDGDSSDYATVSMFVSEGVHYVNICFFYFFILNCIHCWVSRATKSAEVWITSSGEYCAWQIVACVSRLFTNASIFSASTPWSIMKRQKWGQSSITCQMSARL